MSSRRFRFRVAPESLSICRLPPGAAIPPWADGPGFVTISRTAAELSIVCDTRRVPPGTPGVTGRRALGIEGVVDFATTGVIAGLAGPLAEAGISIFVVSTYDTDWILVQENDLAAAIRVLRAEGHEVAGEPA